MNVKLKENCTAGQALGFCLYKYIENKITPTLSERQIKLENWQIFMVDDDDNNIDYDMPCNIIPL